MRVAVLFSCDNCTVMEYLPHRITNERCSECGLKYEEANSLVAALPLEISILRHFFPTWTEKGVTYQDDIDR